MTDQAWALTDGFGIDNLRMETRAAREPGPGEARVRIEWVSLNRRDLLLVEGVYNPRQPAGGSLLGRRRNGRSGRAGTRAGVRSGDRVVISFFPGWIAGEPDMAKLASALGGPGDGVLRDAATIAESALVPLPPSLSTGAASTLPRRAADRLVGCGRARRDPAGLGRRHAGDRRLSLFALQFAKRLGTRVVATTSSEAKAQKLAELGADAIVSDRKPYE